MTEVTKEEWSNWRNDKVTLQFLSSAMNMRDIVSEGVLQGVVKGEERDVEIGKCQGIQALIQLAIQNFDYIRDETNPEDEDGA